MALAIQPVRKQYEYIENLRAQNIQYESIINQLRSEVNLHKGIKYRSCYHIENFSLNLYGQIGTKCIKLCCEPIEYTPGVGLSGNVEESIIGFARMRAEIIAESIKFSLLDKKITDEERNFTSGCAKCVRFQSNTWGKTGRLIQYINLSMRYAPCQSKCIYCSVPEGEIGVFNNLLHSEYYEDIFAMIRCAKKNGMIATDAIWQVSSGEITIHPYRDKIFDLVEGQAVAFYTNCFIFDERIATNLKANPLSAINLSIDAGTKETWRKIKGADNFDTVLDNLAKYLASSARPGQITLKYIILPGINDNLEDFRSVIEIMKSLQVKHLSISSDVKIDKYSGNKEHRKILTKSASQLAAMLYKNNLTMDLNENAYSPAENEEVLVLAKELQGSSSIIFDLEG
jgi:wyosine [tRNA(Phe)-imidazoG37] synthetase (radical SAM superfamily)